MVRGGSHVAGGASHDDQASLSFLSGEQGEGRLMALPPDSGNVSPPFKRKGTGPRSRKSEERAAKLDGGKRVPMSGAGRQKGDTKSARFRGEDKVTEAASYTLKLSDLLKIEREAILTPPCLIPYFRVTIQGHTWRMIREKDWEALGLSE